MNVSCPAVRPLSRRRPHCLPIPPDRRPRRRRRQAIFTPKKTLHLIINFEYFTTVKICNLSFILTFITMELEEVYSRNIPVS